MSNFGILTLRWNVWSTVAGEGSRAGLRHLWSLTARPPDTSPRPLWESRAASQRSCPTAGRGLTGWPLPVAGAGHSGGTGKGTVERVHTSQGRWLCRASPEWELISGVPLARARLPVPACGAVPGTTHVICTVRLNFGFRTPLQRRAPVDIPTEGLICLRSRKPSGPQPDESFPPPAPHWGQPCAREGLCGALGCLGLGFPIWKMGLISLAPCVEQLCLVAGCDPKG